MSISSRDVHGYVSEVNGSDDDLLNKPVPQPTRRTDVISAVVIVLSALFFALFLWLYLSPLLRRPASARRIEDSAHAFKRRGKYARSAFKSNPIPIFSSQDFIEKPDYSPPETSEKSMDPFLLRAPPVPPSQLPARPEVVHSPQSPAHSECSVLPQLPAMDALSVRSLTLDASPRLTTAARVNSFRGLPSFQRLPPLVILSNSQDSLSSGQVLVSPITDTMMQAALQPQAELAESDETELGGKMESKESSVNSVEILDPSAGLFEDVTESLEAEPTRDTSAFVYEACGGLSLSIVAAYQMAPVKNVVATTPPRTAGVLSERNPNILRSALRSSLQVFDFKARSARREEGKRQEMKAFLADCERLDMGRAGPRWDVDIENHSAHL